MWWRQINNRGSEFVNIMGWLTLAISVAGLLSALVQWLLLMVVFSYENVVAFVTLAYEDGLLPEIYLTVVQHMPSLWPFTASGFAFSVVASIGLLLRRAWGLYSFVLLIIGTILLNAVVLTWMWLNAGAFVAPAMPPDIAATQRLIFQGVSVVAV